MLLEILHRAAPCRNVPVTFTLYGTGHNQRLQAIGRAGVIQRGRPTGLIRFPRWGLAGPPVALGAIIAAAWFVELAGHHWNVHGDAILVVILVFALGAAALVTSVVFLAVSISLLRKHQHLRTSANIACMLIAAAYLIVALVGFLIASRGAHAI